MSSILSCFLFPAYAETGLYWLDKGAGFVAATQAEILTATKAARIAADRMECQRRIFEYWPLQEQVTALAGNYEPGGLDSLAAWQIANIAASNTARDAINAAATVAAVEAVTVAWPVWNG